MTGLRLGGSGLTALEVCGLDGPYILETDAAVLAIGHSARDSFAMLHAAGLEMRPKPFAMGVRMEHHQALISAAQYGALAPQLPPADYKLAAHLENGRHVFSFLRLPRRRGGGLASENGTIVTNGMSYRGPGTGRISRRPAGERHPGGFRRRGRPGGGPVSGGMGETGPTSWAGPMDTPRPRPAAISWRAGPACAAARWRPAYRPGVTWTDLSRALPDFVTESLRLAIPRLGRKVRGFDKRRRGAHRHREPVQLPCAHLAGGRTCAPRACRGFTLRRGAGYAGGIVSAAGGRHPHAERILAK
jgi:hypothetical protein